MDIASVGFRADTSPLKTAADDLDAFKAKAAQTGEQLDKLNDSAAKSGDAVTKAAATVQSAGTQMSQAGAAVDQQLNPALQRASGFWANFAQGFREQFQKAIEDGTKATKDAVEPIGAIEAATRRTGQTYDVFANNVKAASNATSISSAEAARSSGIWAGLAGVLGMTSNSMGSNAAAAKELAGEHKAASEFGSQFRETLHTLAPALETTGLKISALTQFSGAARGGLVTLAAAAGGAVAFEMAKASDESFKLQQRLEGLAGVKTGEKLASDFEKMAHSLGVLPSDAAPALEALIKFQNLHGPTNMIPPGLGGQFEATGSLAKNLTGIVETLFKEIRTGGAGNNSTALAEVNRLLTDAAKSGELTGASFRKLQQVAPQAAQAIADTLSYGMKNADQFAAALDKSPLSLRRLVEGLWQLKPAADASFKSLMENPRTVEDALDKLKGKFDEFRKTLESGKDGGPSFIAKQISSTANDVGTLGKEIDQIVNGPVKNWNEIITVTEDKQSVWGKSINVDLIGAFKNLATNGLTPLKASIHDMTGSADEDIRRFNQSFIDMTKGADESIRQFDQSVINGFGSAWRTISGFSSDVAKAASSVASSIASMMSDARAAAQAAGSAPQPQPQSILAQQGGTAPGGGAAPQAYLDPRYGPANTAPLPYDGSGILSPSGDAGTIDLGDLGGGSSVITDDLPAFATGGQFTVQGSGGTDSQLVQFMATPGEVVTVSTPGGGTAPVAGASPLAANDNGSSSGTFADNIVSQTDEMTAKFAQNLAGQTDSLTKKADATTGLITAAIAAQTTALENFWTDLQAKAVAKAQTTVSSSTGLGTSTGGTTDTTTTDGGASAYINSFLQFAPFGIGADGTISVNRPTLAGVANGTGATGNGLGSWLNPDPNYQGKAITDAANRSRNAASRGSGNGPSLPESDAVTAGLRNIPVVPGQSWDQSSVPPAPSGLPDYQNALFPQSVGSVVDQMYGGNSSLGYDYYNTGGGAYDYGNIAGGGYDTTSPSSDFYAGDYGNSGGDYYYGGAFATGGSFTVPGSGGVDSKLVAIHATPGETVSVQQPGAGGGGDSRPIAVNVTINASDGPSAVKSADQIEAAILRAVKRAEARL